VQFVGFVAFYMKFIYNTKHVKDVLEKRKGEDKL